MCSWNSSSEIVIVHLCTQNMISVTFTTQNHNLLHRRKHISELYSFTIEYIVSPCSVISAPVNGKWLNESILIEYSSYLKLYGIHLGKRCYNKTPLFNYSHKSSKRLFISILYSVWTTNWARFSHHETFNDAFLFSGVIKLIYAQSIWPKYHLR